MKKIHFVFLIALIAGCSSFSQTNQPYIGYVYPAGGERGTTINVIIGGQNLRGTKEVYFSSNGISGEILGYQGPSGLLNPLQEEKLRRLLKEIRDKRSGRKIEEETLTETEKKVTLPDIPDLRDLEKKSPKELNQIYEKYLNRENKPKPPMAEEVQLRIKIDQNVLPGNYEISLKTSSGLTNPVVFQVGQFNEFCCTYNQHRYDKERVERDTEILQIPVVLNGRILPGKVNRFTLGLKKGQNILIVTQARSLVPYLADGVPGWFQAVVALYDKNWKEVCFSDDYYFQPDPVCRYTVPEDGLYFLEIRDSIYRGREDFVYRIYVLEENDANKNFPFFTSPMDGLERNLAALPETVKNLPQLIETEQKIQSSQQVFLPVLIKGCINFPGDIDQYRFYGKKGEVIAIEVYGRRIGSPIDSLIRLKNQIGQTISWNDDIKQDIESGLLTHHSDSYLLTTLPSTGTYTVEIIDAQTHGGKEYMYLLRISKPLPDFTLVVSPAHLNIPGDGVAVIDVYAARKDGFDSDIELNLKNPPEGFVLDGARIPAGKSSIRLTMRAPSKYAGQIFPVEIEGRSKINGKELVRSAKPAQEMMQAFAYTHLVPSEKMIVSVIRGRFRAIKTQIPPEGLKIPAGGSTNIPCFLETWFRPSSPLSISFELKNPPEGIRIKDVSFENGKYLITIEADKKLQGYKDNLIIEVIEETTMMAGKVISQKRKTPVGFLPAIPVEVVKIE